MQALAEVGFEERSIVVPPAVSRPVDSRPPPRQTARFSPDDPTGAYLAALDSLARDGRWPRRATETPGGHASRVRAEGLVAPSFPRLAAAYQLVRYGRRPLADREIGRTGSRLRAFRGWLSRS